MILAVLEVNGRKRVEEFDTLALAKNAVNGEGGWMEEAKKSFPHKEFEPVFYWAKKLK